MWDLDGKPNGDHDSSLTNDLQSCGVEFADVGNDADDFLSDLAEEENEDVIAVSDDYPFFGHGLFLSSFKSFLIRLFRETFTMPSASSYKDWRKSSESSAFLVRTLDAFCIAYGAVEDKGFGFGRGFASHS